MRKHLVLLLFLAVAAMLQGCVRSQLLRQETQAFAKTAGDASAAGTKFYRDLIDNDRDLYTTLYVLDASCRPPSLGRPIYWLTGGSPEPPEDKRLETSKGKQKKTPADKPADKPAETPKRWCADQPVPGTYALFSEFGYDSFEREFATLAFTSSYVAALAELAADPKATASKQFADAAADLNTLLAAANKDPVLNKDQIEAASSLFGLLQELSSNARSAREIRALLAAKSAEATKNFERLSDGLLKDPAFNEAIFDAKVAIAVELVRFRGPAQPFERHMALTGYYRAIDTQRSINAIRRNCEATAKPDASKYCGATAAGLMHAAAQAHTDLLNLAAGNLSTEQKAKEAKLAYARFIGVVRLFVSLAAAF